MFFVPPGGMPGFPGGMFGGKGKGKGKGDMFDDGDDEDDEDMGSGGFGEGFGFGNSPGASDEGGSTKQETNNTRLYGLLGVEPSASSADIKKAYHRMAMRHHPDKGGDPETFKDMQQAFEVLSDPEKRKRYDRYGEDGLKDDGPSGPQDIFEAMFGGGGGGRRNQPQRTKDQVKPIWVTLEQLYTGITRPLCHSRKVVDDTSQNRVCEACGGKGMVAQMIRMGPMIQQIQQPCPVCEGTGSSAKLRTEREVLDVFVEKGSPDGQKIVFHSKADEAPGREPGDLVVIVKQQEHHRFLRKGADLYLEREVSLAEALTGFKAVVQHLDGRRWVIRSKPGEVLQPQQGGVALKAVRGGGMPIHQDIFKFGNLFLVLSIIFPQTVEPALASELRRLLGGPEEDGNEADGTLSRQTSGNQPSMVRKDSLASASETEEAVLEDIDPIESAKSGKKVVDEAYEEDDVGPGGMGGVRCNQQ